LQRGEAEDAFRVATKNKLHEAVAESANTVVKKNGVGHSSELYHLQKTSHFI
jgi:hypothetical protein